MRGEETEKKGECAVEYLLLAPLVIEVLKQLFDNIYLELNAQIICQKIHVSFTTWNNKNYFTFSTLL